MRTSKRYQRGGGHNASLRDKLSKANHYKVSAIDNRLQGALTLANTVLLLAGFQSMIVNGTIYARVNMELFTVFIART